MGCCCPEALRRTPPDFGTLCGYAETSSLTTTTSTGAYVTHLTLNTVSLFPGRYFAGWVGYVSSDAPTDGPIEARLFVDGATALRTHEIYTGSGVAALSERNLYAAQAILTFNTAATHTLQLQFHVGTPSNPGDTVSMTWAQIELWRYGT